MNFQIHFFQCSTPCPFQALCRANPSYNKLLECLLVDRHMLPLQQWRTINSCAFPKSSSPEAKGPHVVGLHRMDPEHGWRHCRPTHPCPARRSRLHQRTSEMPQEASRCGPQASVVAYAGCLFDPCQMVQRNQHMTRARTYTYISGRSVRSVSGCLQSTRRRR